MKQTYFIYEGPNKQFEKYLQSKKSEYIEEITLNSLVKFYNEKDGLDKLLGSHTVEKRLIFVARAEEFYSVKDHFIENLLRILEILIDNEIIDFVVLHNPPKLFLNKLNQMKNKGSISIERYSREKITKQSLKKFITLFNKKIKGQENVLNKIVTSLYAATNKEENLPIVLMFYGPPGVGKTETAKLLNSTINEGNIFRQQLSMYKTNEFFSYIFGGEEHNISFSKDIMRYEGNVILFDEFNQCPPGVYSAFFQMFDEGEFEDNHYKVNLSNTIIICTANYNSRSEIQSSIGEALYSRFTEFIEFKPLDNENKRRLIIENYNDILSKLTKTDKKYIESLSLLDELLKQVSLFSNTRNIKKGVELFIMKPLAEKFIEETKE